MLGALFGLGEFTLYILVATLLIISVAVLVFSQRKAVVLYYQSPTGKLSGKVFLCYNVIDKICKVY